MALAVTKFVSTSGPGGGVNQINSYTVTFIGVDVSAEIATGLQQFVEVPVPVDYNYPTLRNAVVTSVQALATSLGLTVADNDVLSPDVGKLDDVIYDTTLTVATTSVTTPTIPPRFRDLQIKVDGRSTAVVDKTNIRCQLNGDASAIYFSQLGYNVANSPGAAEIFSGTSLFIGQMSGTLAPTSVTGFCDVDVRNYAQTFWYKSFYSRWGVVVTDVSSGMFVGTASGRYRSTAAIASVTLLLDAGQFDIGTRMTIRGVS